MHLDKLLHTITPLSVINPQNPDIQDFDFDSRKVQKDQLFVAVKGTQTDGHQFIDKAVSSGAVAVVCEHLPAEIAPGVSYIQVQDSAKALAIIAGNFFGNPAQKLKVLGVTGTNGKTSVATLLWRCMNDLGQKSGLISTIRYMIGEEERASSHTTPDPKQLHQAFAEMLEAGCTHCFMEVSSHALAQQRVAGIPFQVAVFTNLTHDHLDYHGTFANYLKAKKLLFDGLDKNARAIINADDRNANVMVQNCKAAVQRYSLTQNTEFRCRILENSLQGLLLEIGGTEVWFRLCGRFNAYNILAVLAALQALGVEQTEALRVLSMQAGVSGRFETVYDEKTGMSAVVDYAHTPDALENVLTTLEDINDGKANILTVVGCGGNRDKAKRPEMAKIAVLHSDMVILTSDNPRFEEPDAIIAEMYAGVPVEMRKKVMKVADRKEAIGIALRLTKRNDILLIAGKGHETYQEIQGVKYPFDDKAVVRAYLEEMR